MSKKSLRLMAVLVILVMVASVAGTALADKNPIVFVHGWNGSSTGFNSMARYMQGQGWPTSYLAAIQYADPFGSNINNAHQLQGFVNNVRAQTGQSEVDLVAHSMGGLSTRYYIKNMDGINTVESLVTCGSPHHGTPMGYLGQMFGQGGREMIPGSSFLRNLNSGSFTPGDISYTSIYSFQDIVVPFGYSRVDGWNNIGVWWVSHTGLTGNRTVQRHVRNNVSG